MGGNAMKKKNRLLTYISLTVHMIGLNIASAAEYRLGFIIQTVGILFNDLTYIVVWMLFFNRFTVINGWEIQDMALLVSVFYLSFGFLGVFSGGLIDLAKYIARGELDYFLAFPKNVLWHEAVSRVEIPGLGDALFGVVVLLFFTGGISLEKFAVYILVSVLSGIIFINFAIITQSLAFFFGSYEESADRWLWTLFGLCLYPQTIFSGWLKLITMTILPSFFIIYLPVELLNHFDWCLMAWLLGSVVVGSALSLLVFYRGLRRYESGNLINVRI